MDIEKEAEALLLHSFIFPRQDQIKLVEIGIRRGLRMADPIKAQARIGDGALRRSDL